MHTACLPVVISCFFLLPLPAPLLPASPVIAHPTSSLDRAVCPAAGRLPEQNNAVVNLDFTGAAPAVGKHVGKGGRTDGAECCCVQSQPDVSPALCVAPHAPFLEPSAGGGAFAEQTAWPEFHNGVAAGLRLAPGAHQLTRTWVVYNKPPGELEVAWCWCWVWWGVVGWISESLPHGHASVLSRLTSARFCPHSTLLRPTLPEQSRATRTRAC